MNNIIEWSAGVNNYRKMTMIVDPETKQHKYNTELLDVEMSGLTDLHELYRMHLSERQTKYVEVLYSGGIDSELVLVSCLHNKIPVRALTMRLSYKGIVVNTHDLYYAEKFCRERGIEQKIVDIDAYDFWASGPLYDYLGPYYIPYPHVGTFLWMFEQATGFPVYGGDYNWPHLHAPVISPTKHGYGMFDKFLQDRGIHGISNMMSHSLDSLSLFLKTHIKVYSDEKHYIEGIGLPTLKQDVLRELGVTGLEPRLKSYGFEGVPKHAILHIKIGELVGNTTSTITWNKTIADVLGSECPGFNDKF